MESVCSAENELAIHKAGWHRQRNVDKTRNFGRNLHLSIECPLLTKVETRMSKTKIREHVQKQGRSWKAEMRWRDIHTDGPTVGRTHALIESLRRH